MSDFFSLDSVGFDVAASAAVLLVAASIRVFGGRYIRRQRWASQDESRGWLVRLRTATLLFVVVALVVVWANELRAAALTFLALGVAFVIATKELIMSISGSFVRAVSGSFTIGDRVRIGDVRGVVIDHSMLATTLLEIGPSHVRTGRVITVPNSVFLSSPVANESRGHKYVLHSFTVPVKRSEWKEADRVLNDAAVAQSAPYIDAARAQMEARAHRYGLSVPIVKAFILAKPESADTVELTVRVPVAARDVWKVESDILKAWLEASPASAG